MEIVDLPPDEYRALLQRLNRVVVSPPPVGLETMAQIAGRVRQLRRQIMPMLDGELPVVFPLVVVHCVCWRVAGDDGQLRGIGHARLGPYATDRGSIFAIDLSAATLLELDDQEAAALLTHEFLHYVSSTIYARASGVFHPAIHDNFLQDERLYREEEAASTACAESWLSPRLQALVNGEATNSGRPSTSTTLNIERNWAQAGLPCSTPAEQFEEKTGRLVIDMAVAAGRAGANGPVT